MRFLLNSLRAKRQRRYRLRCVMKGKCTSCKEKAEEGYTLCNKCKMRHRENTRLWRLK